MTQPVLHASTQAAIDRFLRSPTHALLLVAPVGSGKATISQYIASQLLNVAQEKVKAHPYVQIIRPIDGKTIKVDNIRSLLRFTTLKPTGKGEITRIGLIEDSHLMNTQAQNALLKTIEEPPAGTVLILTAAHELALLPTIRSRVQQLSLRQPDTQDLMRYFTSQGHTNEATQKALLMSGGLPGLMRSLLTADSSHPLLAATDMARNILQKTTFERLVLADELGRERQLCLDTLFMLQQMSTVAIQQNASDSTKLRRWHHIAACCQEATKQLLTSAQPKLTLTNFMLSL